MVFMDHTFFAFIRSKNNEIILRCTDIGSCWK